MSSPLENPFRPPIPTVVDYEKEAHAIGLLLGPKAEAAYRKRHAHDLSDPSASASSGLTAEEQAQMNEEPKETRKSPERIRLAWGEFLEGTELANRKELLDSLVIHDDGSVSLKGFMVFDYFRFEPPSFPTSIRRLDEEFILNGLESAENLILPIEIGGELSLRSLTSAEHLVLPRSVGGTIVFDKENLPQSEFDKIRASRPDLADKMKLA
ncbi:MAG: hypothetical protein KBC02_02275 [Candidatus Pacebacteria bacterium]|nr:hypothetical protein [Candidatus Paceibacterota bacterium]